jgi:small ligand-binding sensory domain FIST
VTYGPNGENPALHSDTITFDRNYTIDDVLAASPRQAALTVEDVAELGRQLKTQVARITGAEQLLDDVSRRTEVEAAQILLGRVFKVSWLVLPRA